MPTPKHFIAIAKSKKTPAEGHVIWDTAKNEASRPSVRAAALDKKYNPKAEVIPEKIMTNMPGIKPTDATAEG